MIREPKPRTLAVDPGTRHIGIAVLQGSDLVYHGVVTMSYRRAPLALTIGAPMRRRPSELYWQAVTPLS